MAEPARKHAEKSLTEVRGGDTSKALAVLIASRRIGWAMLDVADAIREHAEAIDLMRRMR